MIFTDTIGENVPEVREQVCRQMEVFGMEIDTRKNRDVTKLPCDVATENSRIRILVIRTNEELAIARKVHALLTKEPDEGAAEQNMETCS